MLWSKPKPEILVSLQKCGLKCSHIFWILSQQLLPLLPITLDLGPVKSWISMKLKACFFSPRGDSFISLHHTSFSVFLVLVIFSDSSSVSGTLSVCALCIWSDPIWVCVCLTYYFYLFMWTVISLGKKKK